MSQASPGPAMQRRMQRQAGHPVTTGLLAGLGWGLIVALLDGLPLLLQGSIVPDLGSRLLALAYMAAIYGLLFGFAGGSLGLTTWLILRLTSKNLTRAGLAGLYGGLFVAATAILFWLERYLPDLAGWLFILALGTGLGVAAGSLIKRAATAKALSWRAFRTAAVSAYVVAVVVVLAVAGYRSLLRDLPLLNPPATEAAATAENPNILLITAGGLRPDHLGSYGHDPSISPNIDALAQRGVRFDQVRAQASWTEPSLASLLTSLYPSELGITCKAAISCQPHVDEERTTLAEALRDAGYHTVAYLTSPWLTSELGFAQGFQQFESVRAEEPFDLGPMQNRTLGWLMGCQQDGITCQIFTEGHDRLFDTPIRPGWGGDRANSQVSRFLEFHADERFFLWIHYSEALPPYNLEPPFRPLPEGPRASPEALLKGMGYWRLGDPFAPREKLMPLDVEGLKALYDGEVHRLDRLVGGLLGQLEARGLNDRTLVVLTSDHGQEFMEHGGYTYGHSLYDEVLRVPLIIAGACVTAPGSVVETPVALIDLAPTLSETAGASMSPEAEGHSLVSALKGESISEWPTYSESLYRVPHELKALQRDGYKLVFDQSNGRVELYDLDADAGEQVDVSAEEHEVVEAMKDELLSWIAHTSQISQALPRAVPPKEFTSAVW